MIMKRLMFACSLAMILSTSGCFVWHSSTERDRDVSTSGAGRRCGDHVCDADEQCVESPTGTFHCE
jgi:hypothetical protein